MDSDPLDPASHHTHRGDPDPSVDGQRYAHRSRDAAWVVQARDGDRHAFGKLYDSWFDGVFELSRRIVHDDEVAAEVAQETFLAAWRNLDRLADPEAFGGWLLRIARNTSFNRQRKELRSTPVDDEAFAMIERGGGSGAGAPDGFRVEDRFAGAGDPSRAVEDAEMVALLWGAAEALGGRDAEVLSLHLRLGLSPAEIGEVIGISRNAANQLVHRIRGRLDSAVRARLLWRDGNPSCTGLRADLESAAITVFGAAAVKVIERHADRCEACGERRRSRLQPSAMFAAIPVMTPIVFKQQAAAALQLAGVPMEGSAFAPGGALASAQPWQPVTTPDTITGTTPGTATTPGTTPGTTPEDPEPVTGAHRNRTRNGDRLRYLAAAIVVVIGILGVFLATRDRTSEIATGPGTTTTSPPPPVVATYAPATPATPPHGTSSTSQPATTSTTSRSTTSTGPASSSTSSSSSTTSTTTPPRIEIVITPSKATTPWSLDTDSPVLSWTTAGGTSVRVFGPAAGGSDVTLSTARSGELALCPTKPAANSCPAKPSDYVYTVEIVDSAGTVVISRTATLTVVATIPTIP